MRARTVKVTPLRQNCTVLENPETGRAVVFDPGGDVPELLQVLEGLTVDAILLTHGHFDHAGGADALREGLARRQNAPVALIGPDKRDDFLLRSIVEQAQAFGLYDLQDAHPDRFVEDGETIALPGLTLEVAHCPGHTPGHVVFISRDDKLAIVGDTLFRGVVGRSDFAYGDHQALITGIKRSLLSLPDDFIVLPGHGLPTMIGEERQNNPFLI
ncbi:MBL fold metallo-hydrolase [Asaia krungthepensis]|uniref:Metallo-beta-lactamase n=1 Tax=Asaia krungthepensis NRIC 0535 TaxID=1307925 RepID=A0ABQ0Q3W4_9PROT|nr:MBL fold metallo-hydrolase [Asaia krungthepensis]GBQ90190.1 metallo-beta-lactamase [Asaia krungthepensis NRIC 0535]